MIREQLLRVPRVRDGIDPIVKAYIISESFLWSGWNLVIPIVALFVTTDIKGGNIQAAATGYSIYFMTRVVFELISGRYLSKTSDKQKLYAASTGVVLTSIAMFLFAFAN